MAEALMRGSGGIIPPSHKGAPRASGRGLERRDSVSTVSEMSRLRPRPARPLPLSLERCAATLRTLRDISTVPADIEGCAHLVKCVADELQADQAALIFCDPLTKGLEFVVHNQDPGFPTLYADYYWDLDPTRIADFIRGDAVLPPTLTSPVVFDLMEVVDYGSWRATEFFNDFWERGGLYYDLVAVMVDTPPACGALCLHRSHRGRPFSPEEAVVMEIVAPFVSNHLTKMVSAAVLSTLEVEQSKGMILCDANGRILYCNETARRLCSSLQGAGYPPPARKIGNSGMSLVGYTLSNPTALAELCDVRVNSREVMLGSGRQGTLITLEPRGGPRRWSELLKESFSLTPREIEVLERLMVGDGNKKIARELFIAEITVKKHIQNIASKVGARSRTAIAHAVRSRLDLIG